MIAKLQKSAFFATGTHPRVLSSMWQTDSLLAEKEGRLIGPQPLGAKRSYVDVIERIRNLSVKACFRQIRRILFNIKPRQAVRAARG